MNSPNKMFGGMAGAMAGVLGGATSLGVQDPQTGTMTGVLGGNTNLVGGFGSTGASGTTGGVLSNATAGLMNTGQTPSATGTTSGALASAMPNAGMLSGVDAQPPVKQNQITPSPINPNVLGGFDPQKLTGVPNPTQSFDNTMPQGSALAKKNVTKNTNMKKNIKTLANQKLQGQVGENAVWDGPLSKEGFPMGVGSSSGITGMEVSKYPCEYKAGPITQLAKAYK